MTIKHFLNYFDKSRLTHEQARIIMKDLMDGSSTPAEEKQLYAYFRQRNLPPDMEAQRSFVEWLASGLDDAAITGQKRSHAAALWPAVASVAAAIAVVVTIWIKADTQPDYSIYAGSYTIVNGVKNENIKEIYPQLLEARRHAHQAEQEIELIMAKLEEQERIVEEMDRHYQQIMELSEPENVIRQSILDDIADPEQRDFVAYTLDHANI
ncbi:MAG: hypothetical protein HDS15_05770 [Bacteroides sp.]|nr:hypothetical protein [Bacteroides sp.]